MANITRMAILSILLTGFSPNVFAHPPSEMDLKYFPDSKRLYVEIHHRVEQSFEHYIERIEVQRNNDVPTKYYLRGQETSGLVLKEIKMPAAMGDTLAVRVVCNRSGDLQGVIHLNSQSYYEEGAYFRSRYERPDYRGLERTLDDFRYHRFRDHLLYNDLIIIQPRAEPLTPSEPYNPVDTPQRRQLQKEEEIRRDFHKRLEGGS